MDRFLRVGLPLVLVVVFAVIALFVLNAFEATDLMEAERRAGPTLLPLMNQSATKACETRGESGRAGVLASTWSSRR